MLNLLFKIYRLAIDKEVFNDIIYIFKKTLKTFKSRWREIKKLLKFKNNKYYLFNKIDLYIFFVYFSL